MIIKKKTLPIIIMSICYVDEYSLYQNINIHMLKGCHFRGFNKGSCGRPFYVGHEYFNAIVIRAVAVVEESRTLSAELGPVLL